MINVNLTPDIQVMHSKSILMRLRWVIALGLLSASIANAAPLEPPYLTILGVAQDAGYPQAGCFKPHCLPGWKNVNLQRGATSIAVVDPASRKTYLFEATPNLPAQLYSLQVKAPSPTYQLGGVFLTHAHIGHYAGLIFFGHEAMGADNVPVYAMPRMQKFIKNNGPWSQLVKYNNIQLMPLQNQVKVRLAGINVTPFLVPHRDEFSETVGYRIEGPNNSAIFIPDIDKWSKWNVDLIDLVKSVDYALIDATFYGDGELPGRDMSKTPHPLVTSSMSLLEELDQIDKAKVWFIHMNHTNPLLNTNSDEFKTVQKNGFNVAIEGVDLSL